jgi:hypothetical protein
VDVVVAAIVGQVADYRMSEYSQPGTQEHKYISNDDAFFSVSFPAKESQLCCSLRTTNEHTS